ncbi:MAG: porin family protein, partial [Prevotella sp.]|nr:porin family protein [Prevotella sp.]
MKKIMILAVMMVASLTASAQWSVTPKVGLNLANLAGDVTGNNIKLGLAAGAELMYRVSPVVGVSGGLIYSMQGCSGDGDYKLNIDELNIPILANFYVANGLALKAGIQPGLIMSAKSKTDKVEVDVKSGYQSLELSVPFGISYEISDFVIDARYNLGVAKINKGNGSIRNSVVQLTLGYFEVKRKPLPRLRKRLFDSLLYIALSNFWT